MAVDYFLEIDGIKGESTDDKHKGEIMIESFSWGLSNSGDAAHGAGGGGGAGKVSFQDLHFVAGVSRASPQLFLHCATGEHVKQAILSGRKAGGEQDDFLMVTLTDCLVSSYQSGAASDLPTDQFSLNFSKIEFLFVPESRDGAASSPVKAGFDIARNQKV